MCASSERSACRSRAAHPLSVPHAPSLLQSSSSSAALFTVASSISRDLRAGRNDWVNDFVGGAAAGSVLAAVKYRSLQSGFLGAIAFGAVGASAGIFAVLQPDGRDTATSIDRHRVQSRPVDFGVAAANAGVTARRLT